jgi:predicted transcriptional regulator
VYSPTADHAKTAKAATKKLLKTFFNNSMESAVAAMLGAGDKPLTSDEVKRLSKLIEQASRKGAR